MSVPQGRETVLANGTVLRALHGRTLKLDDPAAPHADQVIVMGAVGLELIPGAAICEADLGKQSALLEKPYCSKDSGAADRGLVDFKAGIDLLGL